MSTNRACRSDQDRLAGNVDERAKAFSKSPCIVPLRARYEPWSFGVDMGCADP
jgi:hypothetical protein